MTEHTALPQRAAELLAQFRAAPPADAPTPATRLQLAGMIDHTILKPDATSAMFPSSAPRRASTACLGVRQRLPRDTVRARIIRNRRVDLRRSGVSPRRHAPEVKAYEAERAIVAGAREIDMVINVGALKGGDYTLVRDDIAAVARACKGGHAHLKTIIEACLLTDEEKVIACLLAVEAGADFVKTSTGFSTGGATEADVRLMRYVVGPKVGVKAAGGIRTYDAAMTMIRAGANRLGASAGVAILASFGG